MKFTLLVWRQNGNEGAFKKYEIDDVSENSSFLEMLDQLNEMLLGRDEEPVAFEHDCREGICGTCSMMINGRAHGPRKLTTTCQLHMREFEDGDVIYIEPWRAKGFPVLKDLIVDRQGLDKIIQGGGYVSINTGVNVDANAIPIGKSVADEAFNAAACIGCGACVAACPNGSAMLFTSAKVAQLSLLPQGQAERYSRVVNMVEAMDESFGGCTNHGECEASCPKGIKLSYIAKMNREYIVAKAKKF